MKNKKIIAIIIIICVLLSIISLSLYFVTINKKETKNDVDIELMKQYADILDSYTEDWVKDLNTKILKIFDDSVPKGYSFNFASDGSYQLSLLELKENFNADLKDFNNGIIRCDLGNSKLILFKNDDNITIWPELNCMNIEEPGDGRDPLMERN
jgi:hypothetical protein